MRSLSEFQNEVSRASKNDLDALQARVLHSPPSFNDIDEVIIIWQKRSIQLGLGDDYRFVPSRLKQLKRSIISVDRLDLHAMEELTCRLFLMLSEPKPDSEEWRIKLFLLRRNLKSILAIDVKHVPERFPATISGI